MSIFSNFDLLLSSNTNQFLHTHRQACVGVKFGEDLS